MAYISPHQDILSQKVILELLRWRHPGGDCVVFANGITPQYRTGGSAKAAWIFCSIEWPVTKESAEFAGNQNLPAICYVIVTAHSMHEITYAVFSHVLAHQRVTSFHAGFQRVNL